GRLPSMWFVSTQPPYGTSMPQGGRRPPHHSRCFEPAIVTSGFHPTPRVSPTAPRTVEPGCQDVLIKPRGRQHCKICGIGMRSSFVEAKVDVSRTLNLIGNQRRQIFVISASAKLKANSPLSCKRDQKPQHL